MNAVSVFPRRKAGDDQPAHRSGLRKPLTLRLDELEPLFCKPQSVAAKELGVSVTTLKQVRLALTNPCCMLHITHVNVFAAQTIDRG